MFRNLEEQIRETTKLSLAEFRPLYLTAEEEKKIIMMNQSEDDSDKSGSDSDDL